VQVSGLGKPRKTPDIAVLHRRHLAVHQLLGVHDATAEGFADRLVAEANAEQRNLAGKLANRRQRDAGLRRRAGAGRNDQVVGLEASDLGDEMASLRKTLTSCPSSPKYWTRL
jgi:hypothetical protein